MVLGEAFGLEVKSALTTKTAEMMAYMMRMCIDSGCDEGIGTWRLQLTDAWSHCNTALRLSPPSTEAGRSTPGPCRIPRAACRAVHRMRRARPLQPAVLRTPGPAGWDAPCGLGRRASPLQSRSLTGAPRGPPARTRGPALRAPRSAPRTLPPPPAAPAFARTSRRGRPAGPPKSANPPRGRPLRAADAPAPSCSRPLLPSRSTRRRRGPRGALRRREHSSRHRGTPMLVGSFAAGGGSPETIRLTALTMIALAQEARRA